jgi:NAD(P)-dependent dehydrogenase (short-subunit alcohol dehydrogenase family)
VTGSRDRLNRYLPDRRAVVFGAASGLGREMSLRLLQYGWRVCAADVDGDRLHADPDLDPALRMTVDVADYVQVCDAVDHVVTRWGGFDLVVNSAGIGAGGLFSTFAVDDWPTVLRVNLLGTVHGCRAALPVLRRQRRGHLVNIASAAAFHALPRVSAYNASKAAVLALSETLASELSGSGVGVTVAMSTFYRSRLPDLTLGTDEDRALTARLAERSGLDAATVADDVLAAAARQRLYCVNPRQAQILWSLKRHLPRTYQRLVPSAYRRVVTSLTEEIGRDL